MNTSRALNSLILIAFILSHNLRESSHTSTKFIRNTENKPVDCLLYKIISDSEEAKINQSEDGCGDNLGTENVQQLNNRRTPKPSISETSDYVWDDNIAYSWVDTTNGTNTGLSGYGGATGPISLPFSFDYFDNQYTSIFISSFGYITFSNSNYWDSQSEMPSPNEPNNVIAPYWTPTYIPAGSWVHYTSGGSAPNRYFVVEWHNIAGGDQNDTIGKDDRWTFEVILYENGSIVFQYASMLIGGKSVPNLADSWWCATSGIENSTGLEGAIYIDLCEHSWPLTMKAVKFSPKVNPAVILVHGWQGLAFEGITPKGYHCDGIRLYNGSNSTLVPDSSISWYKHLAEWLEADGYQVWIAHLDSRPSYTAPLEKNAQCLKNQIETVWGENPQDITIIAHSMGGLVSRASIRMLPSNIRIKNLFTLGSPHAGIPFEAIIAGVPASVTSCILQPAICQMTPTYTSLVFNKNNPNLDVSRTHYYFIGGNGGTGVFDKLLKITNQGLNDGLVGQYSSVGWIYNSQIFSPSNWANNSLLGQFFTNETHPALSNKSLAYYVAPDMQGSQSYKCIKDIMKGLTNTQNCSTLEASAIQSQSEGFATSPSETNSFTEIHTGHLEPTIGTSHSTTIDGTGETIFFVNWAGGTAPTFTLIRPDLAVIDEQYAIDHPSEVSFEEGAGSPEAAPFKAFIFPNGQVGEWQINITASADPIDYQTFAMLGSDRTLKVQMDKDVYDIGDNAIIIATLSDGTAGLAGATVFATFTSPDGVQTPIPLNDNSDGTYSSSYLIPDTPGYLTIDVNASGTDNGTPYTRNANVISAISPDDLQLTGTFDDQPRDDNLDGKYDYLDFSFEVNLATAGEYAVSADLYVGSQIVTQVGDFFNLSTGAQTITLPFYGSDIRSSGLNGPYTVKNLSLTPINIGITAQYLDNAWETDFYSFTQFHGTTAIFSDVPTDYWAWDWIERLYSAGITGGCSTNPLNYCPNNTVTRAQMAVFLLRGIHGSGYTPPAATGTMFADVPGSLSTAAWIEQLANEGITSGCGGGKYCPNNSVTRAQMAIFLLRAKYGSGYTPPPATGTMFTDVPVSLSTAGWIEQLATEGITSGCGGGNYCPNNPVTRASMAVFLVRTFNLP